MVVIQGGVTYMVKEGYRGVLYRTMILLRSEKLLRDLKDSEWDLGGSKKPLTETTFGDSGRYVSRDSEYL
jgi:hypothetical protein